MTAVGEQDDRAVSNRLEGRHRRQDNTSSRGIDQSLKLLNGKGPRFANGKATESAALGQSKATARDRQTRYSGDLLAMLRHLQPSPTLARSAKIYWICSEPAPFAVTADNFPRFSRSGL